MAEVLQKLDKKLYEEAEPLLQSMSVSKENIDNIFKLTETVGGKEVLNSIPGDAGDYLRNIIEILAAMGVNGIEIELGVVRGLDYYTGIVFEAEAPSLGAEKQICGGGSYTLSELFGGEKVFSTGFAIGFDRILLAMEKEGQVFKNEGVKAYVVPASEDVKLEASKVVALLRENEIVSDIDIMGRKMGKAMKYASAIKAEYVVIVGTQELEQKSVTVRNMETGEQTLVKINSLVGFIAN
jgi:histidyl-tRNA synthetase